MKANNKPLVSVIIPCYNHDIFVEEAIQSVIDQDYENIELIIIDDGSKDQSVQVIERMIPLCEQRFSRFEFRHRPNKGLCKTLNEGMTWTIGKYLCSMASDDIWMTNKITAQVGYLEDHPDSIGVFGSITLINAQGSILDILVTGQEKKYHFNDIFMHRHLLPAATGLCLREHIVKVGGYDENLAIEDWSMWLKLTEKGGTLDYIDQKFAFYRRHENNVSGNVDIMHQGRMDIINLYQSHPKYRQAMSMANMQSFMESKKIYFLLNALKTFPLSLFTRTFLQSLRVLLTKH